ncbi:MAG: DUF4387 domain-containing protein [Spirochaetaceae bacterium]|jgi:hypothetical protein|nr:DUF4387 domain-containing protein [Spirochaetaceae bacterium]
MAMVQELAQYVRSKNAGPFWVTLEIFCDKDAAYNTIKNSPNLTREQVARLYGVGDKKIRAFYIDNIRVIKFSFPRPMPSGHKYENDMHCGQQYIRLAEVEV